MVSEFGTKTTDKSSFLRVNLRSGEFEYRTLEGKTYLVAPVVLLTEGVHVGMGGKKLYYPATELSKFPGAWNGRPIPIQHPVDEDGDPMSANSPDVIEENVVGQLFDTWYDEEVKKLRSWIWVDVVKANRVSPQALSMLKQGVQMEVSTGLWHETREESGSWNGEDFEGIAHNYRPDHLALLPNGKGACSWEDGCGVRANQGGDMEGKEEIKDSTGKVKALLGWLSRLTGKKEEDFGVDVNEEHSHDAVRRKLQETINKMDSYDHWHYVEAVYDEYVIIRVSGEGIDEGRMFKRNYSVDENGTVTLGEESEEVRKMEDYVPLVGNEDQGEDGALNNMMAGEEESSADTEKESVLKENLVTALIAAESNGFVEQDKEWLMTLPEERIQAMNHPDPKQEYQPKAEALQANCESCDQKTTTANTAEEYAAQAPGEIKNILLRSLRLENERKDVLIAGLLTNERNRFSEKQLKAKDVDELEAMTDLAGTRKAEYNPMANYALQGGNVPLPVNGTDVPILD